ncbi:DinB family protein [Shouchella clausii]|uniref:DinB family protein n=1 Tax=Shouchella clausii TaxID=79880 RepID=UPI000BA59B86|nr:DinB family protein [Shouchella clausii]PAE94102.1 DltD domain-containing protein [Shouchella clausii]PAF11234.1 DltD domain-containing protein [Shouchella clausii]
MVDAKTVLLDQLLANANDPSWYIPFQEAVKGISEIEAFWKPDKSSHSIAEIVQHLIYWNQIWQTRYEKADARTVPSVKKNVDSFLVPKNKTFQTLQTELLDILLRWQDLITEKQLSEKVKGYPVEAEWWGLIANATTHNAYHVGQIAFLRKMDKPVI